MSCCMMPSGTLKVSNVVMQEGFPETLARAEQTQSKQPVGFHNADSMSVRRYQTLPASGKCTSRCLHAKGIGECCRPDGCRDTLKRNPLLSSLMVCTPPTVNARSKDPGQLPAVYSCGFNEALWTPVALQPALRNGLSLPEGCLWAKHNDSTGL